MVLAGQTGWAATWHEQGAERPRAESWLAWLPKGPRSQRHGQGIPLQFVCISSRGGAGELAWRWAIRLKGEGYVVSF
jgi:hypothetical protein